MNIERFVGLAFSIGLLLLTLFVFLKPQIDYQQEQKIEVVSDTIDLQSDNSMQVVETVTPKKDDDPSENSVPKNKDLAVMNIDQSDFDLFVLRLHVLSSEDNAIAMVKKLEESGVIAFTEIFGENKARGFGGHHLSISPDRGWVIAQTIAPDQPRKSHTDTDPHFWQLIEAL